MHSNAEVLKFQSLVLTKVFPPETANCTTYYLYLNSPWPSATKWSSCVFKFAFCNEFCSWMTFSARKDMSASALTLFTWLLGAPKDERFTSKDSIPTKQEVRWAQQIYHWGKHTTKENLLKYFQIQTQRWQPCTERESLYW